MHLFPPSSSKKFCKSAFSVALFDLKSEKFSLNITTFFENYFQSLFDHIPVGVGSKGMIPMNAKDLDEALEMGMDWSLREGTF